jgi:hypothetical protein
MQLRSESTIDLMVSCDKKMLYFNWFKFFQHRKKKPFQKRKIILCFQAIFSQWVLLKYISRTKYIFIFTIGTMTTNGIRQKMNVICKHINTKIAFFSFLKVPCFIFSKDIGETLFEPLTATISVLLT